jgi:hypothetical protein
MRCDAYITAAVRASSGVTSLAMKGHSRPPPPSPPPSPLACRLALGSLLTSLEASGAAIKPADTAARRPEEGYDVSELLRRYLAHTVYQAEVAPQGSSASHGGVGGSGDTRAFAAGGAAGSGGGGGSGKAGGMPATTLHAVWMDALHAEARRRGVQAWTGTGSCAGASRLTLALDPAGWVAQANWEREDDKRVADGGRPMTSLLTGSSEGACCDDAAAAAWERVRHAAGAGSAWGQTAGSRLASLAAHLQDRWCVRPAGVAVDDDSSGGGGMPVAPLALLCPRHLAPLAALAARTTPPSAASMDPAAGLSSSPCCCTRVLAPAVDGVSFPASPRRPGGPGQPYTLPSNHPSATYAQTWHMDAFGWAGAAANLWPFTMHGLIRPPVGTQSAAVQEPPTPSPSRPMTLQRGSTPSKATPTAGAGARANEVALPAPDVAADTPSAFRRRTAAEMAAAAAAWTVRGPLSQWCADGSPAPTSAASTVPSSHVHSASGSGWVSRSESPPPSPLSDAVHLPMTLPGFLADAVQAADTTPVAGPADPTPCYSPPPAYMLPLAPWDVVGLDMRSWTAQPARLRLPVFLWLGVGAPMPAAVSESELDTVECMLQDLAGAVSVPAPPPPSHTPGSPSAGLLTAIRFPLTGESARRLSRHAAAVLAAAAGTLDDMTPPRSGGGAGGAGGGAGGGGGGGGSGGKARGGQASGSYRPPGHGHAGGGGLGGHGTVRPVGGYMPQGGHAGYPGAGQLQPAHAHLLASPATSHGPAGFRPSPAHLSFAGYVHAAVAMARLAGGHVHTAALGPSSTPRAPTTAGDAAVTLPPPIDTSAHGVETGAAPTSSSWSAAKSMGRDPFAGRSIAALDVTADGAPTRRPALAMPASTHWMPPGDNATAVTTATPPATVAGRAAAVDAYHSSSAWLPGPSRQTPQAAATAWSPASCHDTSGVAHAGGGAWNDGATVAGPGEERYSGSGFGGGHYSPAVTPKRA